MKKIAFAFAAILIAFNSQATPMSKDILKLKADLDGYGATICSETVAKIMQGIANGRGFNIKTKWSILKPNKNPILIDLAVKGDSNYPSSVGAITITPSNGQCVGSYSFTSIYPSKNCASFIGDNELNTPEWILLTTDNNGSGGKTRFYALDKNDGLNFIYNDVNGGCSVTKSEMFLGDQKQ